MVCAGGSVAMANCAGPSFPCGNANPDPCICGRPEEDPQDKAACDSQMACKAQGGTWSGPTGAEPASCFVPDPCSRSVFCNVVTQTDCAPDEKCALNVDAPGAFAYSNCVPNGSVPVGGACLYTYGPVGACRGFDNCVRGASCEHGVCELICNNADFGHPCADPRFVCTLHEDTVWSGYLATCDPICTLFESCDGAPPAD